MELAAKSGNPRPKSLRLPLGRGGWRLPALPSRSSPGGSVCRFHLLRDVSALTHQCEHPARASRRSGVGGWAHESRGELLQDQQEHLGQGRHHMIGSLSVICGSVGHRIVRHQFGRRKCSNRLLKTPKEESICSLRSLLQGLT